MRPDEEEEASVWVASSHQIYLAWIRISTIFYLDEIENSVFLFHSINIIPLNYYACAHTFLLHQDLWESRQTIKFNACTAAATMSPHMASFVYNPRIVPGLVWSIDLYHFFFRVFLFRVGHEILKWFALMRVGDVRANTRTREHRGMLIIQLNERELCETIRVSNTCSYASPIKINNKFSLFDGIRRKWLKII